MNPSSRNNASSSDEDYGVYYAGKHPRVTNSKTNNRSKELPDNYLQRKLNSTDQKIQIEALKSLKDDFVFQKGKYHFAKHIYQVLNIFAGSGSEEQVKSSGEVLEAALQMNEYNTSLFNSSFTFKMEKKTILLSGIQILVSRLCITDYPSISGCAIRCLLILSKQFSVQISSSIQIPAIINFIQGPPKCRSELPERRQAAQLISNVCKKSCTPQFTCNLSHFVSIASINDDTIKCYITDTICSICSKFPNFATQSAIEIIIDIFDNLPSHQEMDPNKLLDTLQNLCTVPNLASIILNLFSSSKSLTIIDNLLNKTPTQQTQEALLKVLISLLPSTPDYHVFSFLFDKKSIINKDEYSFSLLILPFLKQAICHSPLSVSLLLLSISMAIYSIAKKAKLTDPDDKFTKAITDVIDEEFMSVLTSYSLDPNFAPLVLKCISPISSLPVISNSCIFSWLNFVTVPMNLSFWFTKELKKNRQLLTDQIKTTKFYDLTISDFPNEILSNKIDQISFLFQEGASWLHTLFKSAIEMIQNGGIRQEDIIPLNNIEIISSFCSKILFLFPFPPPDDRTPSSFINDVFNGQQEVIMDNIQHNVTTSPAFTFSIFSKPIQNAHFSKSLNKYVKNDLSQPLSIEINAVLNSIGHPPRVFYTQNGKIHPNDTILWHCNSNSPLHLFSEPLSESAIEDNICNSFQYNNSSNQKIFQPVFETLKIIHEKFHIETVNDSFVARFKAHLSSPYVSIARRTNLLNLIFKYPFLFPQSLRELAFRLSTEDPYLAFKRLILEFKIPIKFSSLPRPNSLVLQVDRSNLWNDGLTIIDTFFKNRVSLEIVFKDEVGIGLGPTREFFSLMSKEFIKKERHLFRDESNNDSSEIFAKLGLFPSADPTINVFTYHLFGIFVAKALSLEIPLGINICGALLDYALNRPISVEDIDTELSSSISAEKRYGLIGLDFTYPALGFELIQGGLNIEVTDENLDLYVNLIQKFTVAEMACKAFAEGFMEVMSPSNLTCFSGKEASEIIAGQEILITEEMVMTSVKPSHGYKHDSPQMKMLANVISKMSPELQRDFIEFMTGSRFLPSGGLQSLVPHMSVALKPPSNPDNNPDLDLPAVSVCNYILKLPPYSSQEIMAEKLQIACEEGRRSFDLS